MAGEVFTKVFTFLNSGADDDTTDVFLPPAARCCTILKRLASVGDTRPLVNDFWRYHRPFEQSTTVVSMFLTKPFEAGFSDIPLVNNTYGTFFPLGYHTDEPQGTVRNYISYKLDLRQILILHQTGTYQIKIVEQRITGGNRVTYDIPFCLSAYTPELANKTFRVEIENSGTISDRYDLAKDISFPEGFTNQIRLPGNFGGDNADHSTEQSKMNNKFLDDFTNITTPKFTMSVDPVDSFVHNFMNYDVFQARKIEITDYNNNNPDKHVKTPVIGVKYNRPNISVNSPISAAKGEFKHRFKTGEKGFC